MIKNGAKNARDITQVAVNSSNRKFSLFLESCCDKYKVK
jgi:hypothetical protein